MANNKSESNKLLEIIGLAAVLVFILVNAIIRHDSIPAVISAICGITYTFFAGKGFPVCYLFGITGSMFYSLLAFQNLLWGNLLLYAGYYIPMQILGYFRWNKHLQHKKNEIVKIRLPKQEMLLLIFLLIIAGVVTSYILIRYNDAHPVLDSITTVLSIGGMYLTVRRAIEQWIFWFAVNLLSLIMWIFVSVNGAKVYSTIIMWTVYLFLSVYFYLAWQRELKSQVQ